jgi:glycosyltransferase involved in cell wall biosynthesis
MKIMQILPELNEGGVERGAVELSRELVRRGHQSLVVSRGGKLTRAIEEHGGQHVTVDVCTKNPFNLPLRTAVLRRRIRELQPDIIHVRSRLPAWMTLWAKRHLAIPWVTTVHGMNSVSRYSEVMTRGDKVICVSEVIRSYLLQHYPVPEDKLVIIQRGVDMDVFHPDHTDENFIRDFVEEHRLDGSFVVTSVGRITYLKDYESFIRAIAMARSTIPNIVGVVVGGAREDKTGYFESLKNLAGELGVADRIRFVGSQSRMPEIYQLSDVVVNASLKMGNVGRTVTEALAMNTPVLATTFEGLNNLVQDGLNGYVIEVQNPEQMAQRLCQLYQHPIPVTRHTIDPEFTLERMVENTLRVYESLL